MKLFYLLSVITIFTACSKSGNSANNSNNSGGGGTTPTQTTITISYDSANQITYTSASLYFTIKTGESNVVDRGVVYNTDNSVAANVTKAYAALVSGNGTYRVDLTGLTYGTTYYLKPYIKDKCGNEVYGTIYSFSTTAYPVPTVYLDSSSFSSSTKFTQYWNNFYPWGSDHNGSARMTADKIIVDAANNALQLKAGRVPQTEGNSGASPYLTISYHSGTVYAKQKITVSDAEPYWIISGDFQVPTATGTWPAFWITGANSWPPEIDIMEFKGNNNCWQNTATGPDWTAVAWQGVQTAVSNAGNWHNYKLIMKRSSATNISEDLFIDGVKTATHSADFMNKPFWLIIDLQTEGSSGASGSGPQSTSMQARNVYVASYNVIL